MLRIKILKMSLTIELPVTVEQSLRKRAEGQGVSLENYISQLLTEINIENPNSQPKKWTEAELLSRVQLNVDPKDLEEYYRLGDLFQSGEITSEEHEKLLQLNDLIEIAHAERIKYVIELAKLRNQALEDVVIELGIKRKVA